MNGKEEGSGFVLATLLSETTRIALTAKHVIGEHEATSIQFITQLGRSIPVESVQRDDELDVAVLHLGEEMSDGMMVGRAVADEAWRVETQPLGNDPELTGIVQAIRHPFRKRQGQDAIIVLQLLVAQELGQYKGYSGSPVVLKSSPSSVIGVLIEQVVSRLASVEIGQPKLATNVLYAVPILDVLDRFALAYELVETHPTPQTLSTIRLRRLSATILSDIPLPLVLEGHERLITIGRAPKNMIALPEENVSWEHGQIILKEGFYVYCHLSSSSPTILRRKGLEQIFRPGKKEELPLRNQDRLTIGKTTFVVEIDLVNEDTGYKTTAVTPENQHEPG